MTIISTDWFSSYSREILPALIVLGGLLMSGCNSGPDVPRPADSGTAGARPTGPGAPDADAPQEFTETESGLKYRILRKSDGKKPTASDTVTVHYKGTFEDGSVFDSSYERGEPAQFPLNGVIPGWTEGLQLIGEGGMIELEIPPELGYGPNGMPGAIPPNATLHFVVELIKVH